MAVTKRLTVRKVETLAAPGLYHDGEGLYLQVGNSDSKSWIFRFQIAGRRRDMGLGSLQDVGLADARSQAEDARKLVRKGLDPIRERLAVRTQQRLAEASNITFEKCAEDYVATHTAGWRNAKH